MKTLTTVIKTEKQSDRDHCSTVIIKDEPESKMIDDKALNDE